MAPTVNSYKRFQPGSWAPTAIGWGVDNRTLGFRVVGHGKGCASSAASPAPTPTPTSPSPATIAGGPVRHRQQARAAGAPYDGNGYEATDIARIPWNFADAIELWEGSATIARECFGDDVHHHMLTIARDRVAGVQPTVTDWERRRYLERI